MPNPQITKILEEGIDRYEAELNCLKSIAAIVAVNPQWIEQEPQLADLLKQCGFSNTSK